MILRVLIPPPLVAGIVAAGGFFTVVAGFPPGVEDIEKAPWSFPQNGADAVIDTGMVAAEPTSATTHIAARPVFSESRRPYRVKRTLAPEPHRTALPEPVAKEPQLVLPDWELVGVISNPGTRKALIRDMKTDIERWVSLGASLDGWTVTSIDGTSVAFEQAERAHELFLFR